METREFHDLSELALNSDGQSWGNLGFWTDSEDSYSFACEALATKLGEATALDQNSVIFDAGFGCGDQLCLWLNHFQVRDICGINISESQTQHAQSLLCEKGHTEKAMAIQAGNIDEFHKWAKVIGNRRITHIVALDCAYHFPDRNDFFAGAKSHLKEGGKLALTDFMLTDRANTKRTYRLLLSLMFKLSHIPRSNIVDRVTYETELATKGFHSIRIEDVSKPVMKGFADWVQSQRRKKLPLLAWSKYRVTAVFLHWAYTRSILQYAVVVAVK